MAGRDVAESGWRTSGSTKATQSTIAAMTTIPHSVLTFGVVTSGTSQSVQPRFTTCSSQKSLAMFPAP